ncbi:putative reverse transcriptase domain-containing protein [Tanacetum coccineum]
MKKPTRGRQKRTIQSDDVPRQTAWTHKEEIALCKGWVDVFENSMLGNTRKDAGFWCAVLQYLENKTKYTKWKQSKLPKFAAKSRGGSKRYKSSGSSSFNIEFGEASINLNANVCDDKEDEVHEIRRPMSRDKAKDDAKKKGSRASGSSSANDKALAKLMVTEMASQEKEERLAFSEIKRREVECHEREVRNQEYRQRQEDIRFYLQPYDHLTGDARMAMEELRMEIKKSGKGKRPGKGAFTNFAEMLKERVMNFRQKILICDGSLYLRDWDYGKFRQIADEYGTILMCNMA